MRTYAFADGNLRDGPLDDPVVTDSWLVTDGFVRALDAHRARFEESVRAMARGPAPTEAFWARLADVLPREGDWFPRVELDASGTLGVRVRPGPALGREVTLWEAGEDPRSHPEVKGPDLPVLTGLRDAAVERGADEALLTRGGDVVEGSTTSLLWWDKDILCTPDPALPALPGVTAGLVLAEAESRGIRIEHRRARPAELRDTEVWTLNALHGLRPVTAWVGSPRRSVPVRRAGAWREWLDSLRRPLPRR